MWRKNISIQIREKAINCTENHQLKPGHWWKLEGHKTQRFHISPQQYNQHFISNKLVELQHGNTVQQGLRIQGKHTTLYDKCLKEPLGLKKQQNELMNMIAPVLYWCTCLCWVPRVIHQLVKALKATWFRMCTEMCTLRFEITKNEHKRTDILSRRHI